MSKRTCKVMLNDKPLGDGTLTVYPDGEVQERAFALDVKAAEGDKPVWIQIARVGQWHGHPAGTFRLSPREFDEIVANFKATKNRRIPFDFEHASEMDPRAGSVPTLGAPAQGWILDLDNRGEGGLWALVQWLEPARTYIREGKYRWVSPTIRFNAKDRESGMRAGCVLSSVALTNQPFLDGLQVLAAKDINTNAAPGAEKTDNTVDFEKLYKEAQAEIATLKATNEKLAGDVKTLKDEAAATTLTLKDVTSTKDEQTKELETLRKFKADTEEKAIAERVDLAFATYKDEKKLTEDDKEAMRIVLSTKPETFEKLYPKAQPGTPHLLRNLTGGEDGGAKRPAVKPDPETNIVKLADKIQAEQKCDRDTAFALAEKQIKAAR